MKKFLFVSLVTIILQGCSSVETSVTTISDENSFINVKLIYIVNSNNNIEERKYNKIIATKLLEKGFKVTNDKYETPYHLSYKYDINGVEKLGSSTSYKTATISDSKIGRIGSDIGTMKVPVTKTYSYTEYTKFFELRITKNKQEIYLSRAISKGSDSDFNRVAECIINSALWDFPESNINKEIFLIQNEKDAKRHCKKLTTES